MKNKLKIITTILLLLSCFIGINTVNASNSITNSSKLHLINSLDNNESDDLYIGSIDNETENANQVEVVKCGNIGDPGIPAGIPKFTRTLYTIVRILVPVAIIILGILDFVKAAIASKEQDMKEYQNKFIRRLISGVAIFLVLAIVNFVFRQAKFDESESFLGCVSCLFTTQSACSTYTLNDDGTYTEVGNTPKEKKCMDLNYEDCEEKAKCSWNTQSLSCEYNPNKPSCSTLGIKSCTERSDCIWTGSQCSKK